MVPQRTLEHFHCEKSLKKGSLDFHNVTERFFGEPKMALSKTQCHLKKKRNYKKVMKIYCKSNVMH